MYLPRHFAEDDADRLHELMRQFPLATVITQSAAGLDSSLIPLHLDLDGDIRKLVGHVARANPVWREHPAEVPVLALFHGGDTYVSPSWYPTKHEHGKAVPTWNYRVVQVRGTVRFIDDAEWLRRQLDTLVSTHEASLPAPWQMSDAPADYIEQMLRAVVGIEITITELQGKFKLSQNQTAANRQGVIRGLQERNTPDAAAMARVMRHSDEG